jgi:hypothetical protein
MANRVSNKWAPLRAIVVSGALALAAAAQAGGAGTAPPDGAPPGPAPEPQTLSADQAARVKAILQAYKPASLDADSAKAIHRAFRDAGIRPGPGLRSAIEAAGFDPRRLHDLDPPPDHPPGPPRDEPGQDAAPPRR